MKDGDKTQDFNYLFGIEGDDKATVYAKLGDRDLVFAVRKSIFDALQNPDLVDPTVFTLDLSKVRGMKLTGWKEFSVNGQPQTLDLERKVANDWTVKGAGGYKLSSSAAEAFLLALQSVRAEKVVVFKTGPKPEQKLTADAGALGRRTHRRRRKGADHALDRGARCRRQELFRHEQQAARRRLPARQRSL